ncbi:MAG: hypothetical protein CVV64_07545 [Candidatus Wallbacteria bacterium HGW-Wallbacteria-1]|jgi:alpha-1,3-rhamnosyl/mannosyltransferase|uniref:Glycosyl transferase family 1 domain-containing protein n=1 Tax=Candidatus Wallbacteria bacterium HGW-Wallbacteria-1 TaxID=2013854 RepID=A0A2N1PQW7_9BACT|nr:MAG: hypothetical protein CVV64_07545 [Candidatus Wallbacteria bacterium HGW-Wallbacteria-1]
MGCETGNQEGIQIPVRPVRKHICNGPVVINAIPLRGRLAGLEQVLAEVWRQIPSFASGNGVLAVSRDWYENNPVNCEAGFPVSGRKFYPSVFAVNTGSSRLTRIISEQLMLPKLLHRMKADRVFSLCNVSPVAFSGKQFVMVHDLHWFRQAAIFRGYSDKLRAGYVRSAISLSIARSQRVYTGSPHSANDIGEMFGVTARVFPWGARSFFYDSPHLPCPVSGEFLLFVGQTNRRKNLPAFIKAVRGKGFPPLVIAGSCGDGESEILQTAVPGEIIRLGEPDDATVHSLLANAQAMVYPSLYEGFGLPVIEAMAAGCPVVAAAVTSIPFVAAGAAVLVDPHCHESMALGVEKVMNNRSEYIRMGRLRAQGMTMEAAVSKLLRDIFSDN